MRGGRLRARCATCGQSAFRRAEAESSGSALERAGREAEGHPHPAPELRVVMVIFVLRPLTQFFMQEYREGVRNEYYNVQLTPLPRLRPL